MGQFLKLSKQYDIEVYETFQIFKIHSIFNFYLFYVCMSILPAHDILYAV